MWTAEAGLTGDSPRPAETGADPTNISWPEGNGLDRVGPPPGQHGHLADPEARGPDRDGTGNS